MEYGCVFVMKHRQGLSGKVLSLQQQRQGVGSGGPDPSVKGTSLIDSTRREAQGGFLLPEWRPKVPGVFGP